MATKKSLRRALTEVQRPKEKLPCSTAMTSDMIEYLFTRYRSTDQLRKVHRCRYALS